MSTRLAAIVDASDLPLYARKNMGSVDEAIKTRPCRFIAASLRRVVESAHRGNDMKSPQTSPYEVTDVEITLKSRSNKMNFNEESIKHL